MTATTNKIHIPDRLYFRIGDVADLLGVKPYVLRYWESEFPMINPQKSSTGQRVYRKSDVETVVMIKRLLYEERYSIEGAKKKIKELRKEGELKLFKDETLAIHSSFDSTNSAISTGVLSNHSNSPCAISSHYSTNSVNFADSESLISKSKEELKMAIADLRSFIQTPISDLFKL